MLRTWLSTVRSEMNRRAPICLLGMIRLAERQPDRGVPAQAFSGLELGLESRCPKRHDRRLFGLGHERSEGCDEGRTSLGSHGFGGAEQLRREPGLASADGAAPQRVEQAVLCHPVIDLLTDPQRFREQRLRAIEITGHQRGNAEVEQHHFQTVEIAGFPAETRAFGRRGADRLNVALEHAVECSRLEQRDRRGDVIEARHHGEILIEQAPGSGAITGHVRGDRCHGERVGQRREISCRSRRQYCPFKRWPGSCRIALQHGQESADEVRPPVHRRVATSGRCRGEQLVEPPNTFGGGARGPIPAEGAGEVDSTEEVRMHQASLKD